MKVILFSNSGHELKNRFITILEAIIPAGHVEVYDSILNLSKRLKVDTSDVGIVLLSIPAGQTLNELLLIRNQLVGHRIIIVLPDQNSDTLSKAHMLIKDLNMPNMDGIELIKNVRAQQRFKFIPIIMLTTESQDAKKQEGKAAGA